MVGPRLGQAADTVITVAENLDSQAVVTLGKLVEPIKQLVEELDQFLGRALG